MPHTRYPQTDIDLFAPGVAADPHPVLADLRRQGSAVHCSVGDFYLLSRYGDVRAAAADWRSFSSSQGVALTNEVNAALAGSLVATDPPEHESLRSVLAGRLSPRGLDRVREQITEEANRMVAAKVAKGAFDAVTELAHLFPVNVVGDLVGLPVEGRETMRPGADAMLAGFGPIGDYAIEHAPQAQSYQEWVLSIADRSKLTPGGWGEVIMDAVDDGRLTEAGGLGQLSEYLTAGMDTTVNALGSLLRLLAERPDVWEALKQDRSLARPIFEEILRLESPLIGFWRVSTGDVTVGDATVPKGAKVLLHWAAANRDPAKYPEPDEFQVERNPVDHLAFGHGVHACAGQGLARMEAVALLDALATQVDTLELAGEPIRGRNPMVRGYASVPVKVSGRS
jgi:cytochrome P450